MTRLGITRTTVRECRSWRPPALVQTRILLLIGRCGKVITRVCGDAPDSTRRSRPNTIAGIWAIVTRTRRSTMVHIIHKWLTSRKSSAHDILGRILSFLAFCYDSTKRCPARRRTWHHMMRRYTARSANRVIRSNLSTAMLLKLPQHSVQLLDGAFSRFKLILKVFDSLLVLKSLGRDCLFELRVFIPQVLLSSQCPHIASRLFVCLHEQLFQ